MAKKIVNLRLSEEMIDLINQQIGDTFTQKFENMVTRCMWELPAAEQQLKIVKKLIAEKKDELHDLSMKAQEFSDILDEIGILLSEYSNT